VILEEGLIDSTPAWVREDGFDCAGLIRYSKIRVLQVMAY